MSTPAPTVCHALTGPSGQPVAALFTGPAADEAAELWARVLWDSREELARRGAQYRHEMGKQRYRRLRHGDGVDEREVGG